MSEQARKEFDDAHRDQIHQNDARTIRGKVQAAERDPHHAGRRWPFELLQNAHDPGCRDGRDAVDVDFAWDGTDLRVSHDGKFFSAPELAALLTGGSNKGFDDETTTGRFGTGFLVTHGLSTEVDVEGLLSTETSVESFKVELRRGGDEASIVANIRDAQDAFSRAEEVGDLDRRRTVTLTYLGARGNVVDLGFERLEQALPFLYATCSDLGRVRIERPGAVRAYRLSGHESREAEGIDEFEVEVSREGEGGAVEVERSYVVVRMAPAAGARASLLALLDGAGVLQRPPEDFPRVFITFPIIGTQFLPFEIILNGYFTPQQERNGLLMGDEDRGLVEEALSGIPNLVHWASKNGWGGGHRLAYLALPPRTFSTEGAEDEMAWWKDVLKGVAMEVAKKPVISTSDGLLPAIGEGDHASFVVPAYDADAEVSLQMGSVHPLAEAVMGLHPVSIEVAEDWGGVAEKWQEIGIGVERVGVAEIAARVKGGARTLADLPVVGDPVGWVADLLQVASDLPADANVRPVFANMLPNQRGELRSWTELLVDGGVPDTLKDIAELLGVDLRRRYLNNDLAEATRARGGADGLLRDLVPQRATEEGVVKDLLERLRTTLGEDQEVDDGIWKALKASAALAAFLADSGRDEQVKECPVATSEGRVAWVKKGAPILVPVASWPEAERDYASLYPEGRILHPDYAADPALGVALGPMGGVGLTLPGMLYRGARTTPLEPALLHRVAVGDVEDVSVRGEFGQIALLSQVVLQRCRSDRGLAELLLEFVLRVAAEHDGSWRDTTEVEGTRGNERVAVRVRSALWPAELSIRTWIPVEAEDGESDAPSNVPGNAATLQPLLKPEWLRDNTAAIELLSQEFGFKPLNLFLSAVEEGEAKRTLESHLVTIARAGGETVAEMVDLVSSEPGVLRELREKIQEKRLREETKTRNRRFGIAVQEAVAKAIEERRLMDRRLGVKLVDYGFDFEVSLDGAGELDRVYLRFEVGSYLLEVKATTTGEVRLTPKQAETAATEKERFVLCVVDLQGVDTERLVGTWTAADVEPLASFLNVSGSIGDVYDFVEYYSGSEEGVGIRNQGALRYAVRREVWKEGRPLGEWVDSLAVSENGRPEGGEA